MTTSADGAHEREARPRSAAYDEGFEAFPVSLPFAPLDILNEYQREFYDGWIAAAYMTFGHVEIESRLQVMPGPASKSRES